MNQRELARKKRVNSILEILKQAKAEDREIDYRKLRFEIMFEYGCTSRTAKEYIDTAMTLI